MTYQPGSHILSRIYSLEKELLTDYKRLQFFLEKTIEHYGLHKVGETFHSFENAGYTGVICLTESHIAFHTWPEYQLLTLDVYLSNHKTDNGSTSKKIFEDILTFFKATHHISQEVLR